MSSLKPSGIVVVMATFNGEEFIQQQLHSIANQTVLPERIVISDDGSTDGTIDLIERFATGRAQTIPVELHHRTSTGNASDNFRSALAYASGDWVAFCDQDDVWHPSKLQTLLDSAERTGAALAACNYRVIDEIGDEQGQHWWPASGKKVSRLKFPLLESVMGCCTLVARRVVDRIDQNWPHRPDGAPELHDFATTWVARHLGGIMFVPQVLHDYRRHGSNASAHYALDPTYERSMRAATTAESYRAAASIAQGRADWWEAQGASGTAAEGLARLDWMTRTRCLSARAKTYDAIGLRRLAAFAASLASGCYGPTKTGRLPARSFAADLIRVLRVK